jgi:predicted amidohydrolase
MPENLIIATCQHPIHAEVNKNLSFIRKQILEANARGADIVHFSECNLSGYAGEEFDYIDKQNFGNVQNALMQICELAGKLNIWVIVGSHHFENGVRKPYNSLHLINDKGLIINRYDKRLLYGAPGEMEHKHYSPGTKPVVFRINGIDCGLLICHEWRYPELYREYYKKKVKVLFQSWYDGNLSSELYRKEGKELGELITGTVKGNAANNYLWISASNNSRKESSFPAFVAQPDGKTHQKLTRNRAGVLISRIDPGQVFPDPSSHNRDRTIRKC